MICQISFTGIVEKFPGPSGWVYITVPKKYKKLLQSKRRPWGMYPITAHVGGTSWNTKLMIKKGGHFFVALKQLVRTKENIALGKCIRISIDLL